MTKQTKSRRNDLEFHVDFRHYVSTTCSNDLHDVADMPFWRKIEKGKVDMRKFQYHTLPRMPCNYSPHSVRMSRTPQPLHSVLLRLRPESVVGGFFVVLALLACDAAGGVAILARTLVICPCPCLVDDLLQIFEAFGPFGLGNVLLVHRPHLGEALRVGQLEVAILGLQVLELLRNAAVLVRELGVLVGVLFVCLGVAPLEAAQKVAVPRDLLLLRVVLLTFGIFHFFCWLVLFLLLCVP